MYRKIFLVVFTFFLASICLGKKVVDFEVNVKNGENLFYGESVALEFINVYNNGKKKEFKNRHHRFIKATVKNGKYVDQRLYATLYPTKPDINFVEVNFEYDSGNGILKKTVQVPLHFKGNLNLNFAGKDGASAKDKGNRIFGSMIGRDGRTGKDGYSGENGGKGSDILVSIWNDENNRTQIKATNLENGQLYFYQLDQFEEIVINTSGGHGGNGGDGGEGGDGKDGENDDGKIKSPGNGGQGGNGGNGGNGGDGGSIIVYVHPNAKEVLSKIRMINQGGNAGTGGVGGEGGDPGDPLEGQDGAAKGTIGGNGSPGISGQPGENAQIEIKNFTIKND